MLWAIFGVLLVFTGLSFAVDVENSTKFDGPGITKTTVMFAALWVLVGLGRELINAIDPLM